MKLLGPNDATYTPCVGLLASPYTSGSNESEILVYWVAPPAESCPNEYGKPLKMVYSMVTDPCLSQEVLTTAETLIDFYKTHPRVVSFRDQVLLQIQVSVLNLRLPNREQSFIATVTSISTVSMFRRTITYRISLVFCSAHIIQ